MLNKIKLFFEKKWIFKKITKSDFLIIEHDNSNFILKYLPVNKTQILSFKILNLYIILKILFSKRKISKLNYFIQAIELIKPNLVITMIDNDTNFYRLKKYFPNKKFISIQNGYRTEPIKTYKIKKGEKLSCDIIFCFGKQNINYYKSFINTKVITSGSLKNNLISKKNLKKKKVITYISEFRPLDENTKINFYNVGSIYWGENLASEKKMLEIASEYCRKKNITFNILGRYHDEILAQKERDYFQNIIKNNNFHYIKSKIDIQNSKNLLFSYNFLKTSQIILSMSSSLGYEFFSRNNKMIFFSRKFYKSEKLSKYYKFGWPSVKKDKGFFYSNEISDKEMSRLAKNVIECSQNKWIKIQNQYQKNLISFDFKNNKIKKELRRITNVKR